jgi:D-amino peptidase
MVAMKIYISADIEGTTGIAHWDEADYTKSDYKGFRSQMTAEVKAACEGVNQAGAKEILIKDAHASGRNLNASELPENIKIIREWSGHPFSMMQDIDDSFSAAVFTGYHSRAGSDANTLAHTLREDFMHIRINGTYASEFLINAYTAAYVGVPVVMVTGDKGLCEKVKKMNPNITTVAVNEGKGASTISIHPSMAVKEIRRAAKEALSKDISKCKLTLPSSFEMEILYKDSRKAYRNSFYPGSELLDASTILFQCQDYFDVLRFLSFTSHG